MAERMRHQPAALVRRMLLALAVALVLVQTLGVLHRVMHASHGARTVVSAPEVQTIFSGLWGDHTQANDCQSFDQASPDLLHSAATAPVVQPMPAQWYSVVLHERFALFERFFSARGPPASTLT